MNEWLPADAVVPLVALLAFLLLLIAFVLVRQRRSRVRTLRSVLNSIAFDRLNELIIPKADEGEIQIDHLLLTAHGLLIIDIKDVDGIVFGSDKMDQWTVIGKDNRFTFQNPQPALYDRIAAVRQIVRQVPVEGRVLFLDGAVFSKGVPSLVATLDDLLHEFGEEDKVVAKASIEAFTPHWAEIRGRAAG